MIETRLVDSFEVQPKGRTIVGLAVPYGKRSVVLSDERGRFTEEFRQGAFSDHLKGGAGTYVLWNHDTRAMPLGRSGVNLSLEDSADGLRFTFDAPNTQAGNDLVELLGSGILPGKMSFGFSATAQEWALGDPRHRTVTRADLAEISFVMRPAYPQTDAKVATAARDAWNQRLWSLRLEGIER